MCKLPSTMRIHRLNVRQSLTDNTAQSSVEVGERYSFKIKYRFQVFVPKRQILR